jgi:hypothetical protein
MLEYWPYARHKKLFYILIKTLLIVTIKHKHHS